MGPSLHIISILLLMQYCWAEKKESPAQQNGCLALWFFLPSFPWPETRIFSSERQSNRKQWVLSSLSVPAASFRYDFTEIQAALSWGQRGEVPICLAQLPTSPAECMERVCCLWKTCGGWSCLPNSFPPPSLCREQRFLQRTTLLASRAAQPLPGRRCLAGQLWQQWRSSDTNTHGWSRKQWVKCSAPLGWGVRGAATTLERCHKDAGMW